MVIMGWAEGEADDCIVVFIGCERGVLGKNGSIALVQQTMQQTINAE
jgi:hypothetical protein